MDAVEWLRQICESRMLEIELWKVHMGTDEELMSTGDFDREKHAYVQNCESMRSVNAQMNRLPTFSVTLTGGIWFGITLSSTINEYAAFGVLLLAGVANFCLILIAYRTRDVIQSYLETDRVISTVQFRGRPAG